MSLIADALKRVQESRYKQQEEERGVSSSTIVPPIGVFGRIRLFLSQNVSLLIAAILVCFIIIGYFIFFLKKSGKELQDYRPPIFLTQLDQKVSIPDVSESEIIEPPKITGQVASVPKKKAISKQEKRLKMASIKKEVKKEIKLSPRSLAIEHFNLGVLYQKQGQFLKAKRAYEKVINIDPSNAQAHNNLGIVYKNLGDLTSAIKEYEKAILIDPKYDKAYYNLAAALYVKGELESAINMCEKAISLNPVNIESYNLLGIIYRKQSRDREAENIFRQALELCPEDPQTHYNFALLLEEKGNLAEAIFHYQRFIELSDKNSPLVAKVKSHLNNF